MHGPSVEAKSLPLAGPKTHLHFFTLYIARRPIVEDGIAEYVTRRFLGLDIPARFANHCRYLKFVIQFLCVGG